MSFEELLGSLVDFQTDGRDWRHHTWPPGTSIAMLAQALNSNGPLPSWRLIHSLLNQLGASVASLPAFHAAYERAKLYRPWSDNIHIQQGDDQGGTYVIQNTGGTIYLQPERRSPRRMVEVVEPMIQDAPGYNLKPDPLSAQSLPELERLARDFWRWADKPSSRQLATHSKGAFSHATIAKIIYDKPDKPPLTMRYLLGLIRGCGGDKDEQQRWATAWRLLDQGAASSKPALTMWTTRAG
ncbi:hypothetical protein ABZ297_34680 [Nonomuraea sp. NPDC005983]|uniref:hypothetical protein n=1 Tax=Nonomuraea sp. NPDC005983 TaxID=3155595 RepID=UPI0033B38FF0